MKRNNYLFVILIILKYLIVLYTFYIFMIIACNLFLEKTKGEIIEIKDYQEKIVRAPVRFENAPKGYVEKMVWRKKVYYKYYVNQNEYVNSRISNVLIFPTFEFKEGDEIFVYYSSLINNYSVVFKCNFIYFFINCLPIIIVFVVMIMIKKYVKRK